MNCKELLDKTNDPSAYFKCQDDEQKKQREIEEQKIIANTPKYIYTSILSPIGFMGGVAYAFSKKTGFWKGWGIAIIGSIVLGGIGAGIDRATFLKKQK
jgi:hypothetical protein